MEIRIKKTEVVEIDDEQALEITREVLRGKFGIPKRYGISDNGNLVVRVEGKDHYFWGMVRRATEQERLFFAVLKVLEGGENADAKKDEGVPAPEGTGKED